MLQSAHRLQPDHPGYPGRLRSLPRHPDCLWVRGRLPTAERVVSIVGARAARARDMELASAIARDLASDGAVIISGGALGVDSASHRGALASGRPGATAAVLGCGVNVTYPARNSRLFEEICAAGGALVSQLDPDAPPRPWHFVERNRTMAGMADATLIIAATARSGSLHTARAARAFGRVVAAVPGTPGCEALIASGACVARDADDLVRALEGSPVAPEVALPEEATSAYRVLACLGAERALHPDRIAMATGLGIRDVSRALTSLELDGLAVLLPGRNYVRSTLAETLLAQ